MTTTTFKRERFRYLAYMDGSTLDQDEMMTTSIVKVWMRIESMIERDTRPGETISATVWKLSGRGQGEFDRVYNNVHGKAVRAR